MGKGEGEETGGKYARNGMKRKEVKRRAEGREGGRRGRGKGKDLEVIVKSV